MIHFLLKCFVQDFQNLIPGNILARIKIKYRLFQYFSSKHVEIFFFNALFRQLFDFQNLCQSFQLARKQVFVFLKVSRNGQLSALNSITYGRIVAFAMPWARWKWALRVWAIP